MTVIVTPEYPCSLILWTLKFIKQKPGSQDGRVTIQELTAALEAACIAVGARPMSESEIKRNHMPKLMQEDLIEVFDRGRSMAITLDGEKKTYGTKLSPGVLSALEGWYEASPA